MRQSSNFGSERLAEVADERRTDQVLREARGPAPSGDLLKAMNRRIDDFEAVIRADRSAAPQCHPTAEGGPRCSPGFRKCLRLLLLPRRLRRQRGLRPRPRPWTR